MDPNNLIWMGWKWRHGDVSLNTENDLDVALSSIKAKVTAVAFSNDMFFPPTDIEAEVNKIPNAQYEEIESLWAHFAMFCMNDRDKNAIDDVYRRVLAS